MASAAKSPVTKPFLATLHLNLETIESGVPLDTMSSFAEASGVPMKDLYDVVIAARTLKHRRARREPLSRDESDKLTRVVRVFDHAVKVFDGSERALIWLEEPKRRFDGRAPIEMLRTETGARMVDEFLGQIEYGMFA